jgi:hypothetical protein
MPSSATPAAPFAEFDRSASQTAKAITPTLGVQGTLRGDPTQPIDQAMQLGESVRTTEKAAVSPASSDNEISGSGPGMQTTTASTLSDRRDLPQRATGAILVSELRSITPTPFRDDKGNPVLNDNGKQMMMPSDADPHFFVDAARIYGLAGLVKFRQGGPWDLQRVGPDGRFISDFTDFSTVAIGLYGAALGIPLDTLLSIEDRYASDHSRFGPAVMDAQFTHLAATNVANTRLGYELFSSGRIAASPTGEMIQRSWTPQ